MPCPSTARPKSEPSKFAPKQIQATTQKLSVCRTRFKPRATRLTFRVLSDSSKCKIYASAGEIVIYNFDQIIHREFFSPKTQCKTKVQPNGLAENCRWKAVARVKFGRNSTHLVDFDRWGVVNLKMQLRLCERFPSRAQLPRCACVPDLRRHERSAKNHHQRAL